jgi:lipid-binding SYLF domain-containing protein
MKQTETGLLIVILAGLGMGCSPSSKLTVPEQKKAIMDMEQKTLERLYTERPSARDEVAASAGYGTFSNANVNVIFVSMGGGYGVVVDNATGARTFMKMGLGGVGIGVGAKDYRQVLIFKTQEVMDKFTTSGWEFGGHADAAAKAGEKGGELSGEGVLAKNITIYSMTETGLALQATVTGTRYWSNKKLNQSP